ncbi:atrial natriuretic peptide receptor 2-like [Bufo gargarizans]|uniref:atrial natriuretic peptide receptor 2-like n=1 Tax=Bufo gargarizans TaxID=30331 RepID=UPI001CF39109|nr:atrial natriuretic peptide receptor 2-like [Bufo gargarizans]
MSNVAQGWHDLDNTEYDCWPLEKPDEVNMIDCGGLEMAWVLRPPAKVYSGETFNVIYSVSASDDFYVYAVANGILSHRDAESAKRFCEEQECPANWKDANGENCCIHHANIHSCPISFMGNGGICGPWIPDDGQIFTHTLSVSGQMTQGNWSAKVALVHAGVTSLIAHIRIGNMQVALEAKTLVLPIVVCGNSICEEEEACATCPVDCGECSLPSDIRMAIAIPVAIIVAGFILSAVGFQYQRQRMFWDESWIIKYSDIKQERKQRVTLSSSPDLAKIWLLETQVTSAEQGSRKLVQARSKQFYQNEQGAKSSRHAELNLDSAKTADEGLIQKLATIRILRELVEANTTDEGLIQKEATVLILGESVEAKTTDQWLIQKTSKRHDGRIVAIKKIPKKTFTLSKTIRREIKQIRDLDHPNLCKFIGGCIEVPDVALITEYCPKGSLNDVLLNEDIPLNWGFRFSFATDIAHGMAYLHQHKIYHSRLKSTNCVIDDRWVCKITDYGLDFFRKPVSVGDYNAYKDHPAQAYIPPETASCHEKSAALDMHSYAIILLEIAIRNDPASKDESNSAEYCCLPLPELIKGKADNTCPCPSEYVDLIRQCRSQNPAQRPTFEQVKKLLYKMNPNKVSPVDMMMTLMEKYSKHLELLVAERTQDLVHEKQKTDRLLYSMLPRQVADDLRQGKHSQAQSYSSATVFFSDIVGFTNLSSTSTPYQVVDFLNKLYTTFDDIIDNYDVYKVETIGDAYMVVSGVPKENGIYHASEIASMALDLVGVCKTFRIPHKPNTQLKIRAGIHSGPVVAGVVGTKMPRYCLFGDTVNTASRMESTSEALKVQCSSSAYDLLKQIGGYKLVCRGTLTIKGKGDMTTYWLEGKTATSTQNIIPNTSAVMQEKERESFNLIPGVISTEALSASF